uniref:Cytochrome b n=1 Tax=Pneumocystis murina (strain B123) TaxID=1069680 RepID=M1FRL7_PNEMU|nr:apocytochrome b [Pneumocystis murina]AFR90415.1 apocytochrome b [Pneumocystis murina]
MRIIKVHPFLSIFNSYMIDSPQPTNLSYLWNYGSLLGVCLTIQIVTGITLAMHYIPSIDLAFLSVEHIMRDVNYGWLIRYLHSNTASFFFLFVYLHIARGIYYGSYRHPRTMVWSIGVLIFLLMIITAFLGYVLPFGQMSLWGATVITNLLSAIPWIGSDLVNFIWGGFSVNHATLNRFFSLHYLLPFLLAGLVIAHLIALHEHGSGNPLGITGNVDRIPFHPYYSFKDLVTVFLFFIALSYFVFYNPNVLGHSDNYIMANPMSTPPSIVPEWYLLPFYAILRSISDKLLGVVAMLASILILWLLPVLDLSRIRGSVFRPISKFLFWIFVTNFLLLMYLGSQHVEEPYITIGKYATIFYFSYFIFIIPVIAIIENTLSDLALEK